VLDQAERHDDVAEGRRPLVPARQDQHDRDIGGQPADDPLPERAGEEARARLHVALDPLEPLRGDGGEAQQVAALDRLPRQDPGSFGTRSPSPIWMPSSSSGVPKTLAIPGSRPGSSSRGEAARRRGRRRLPPSRRG
jgi:hypothetical protein